jgi:fibronectin type 3 domain-containing protein
LLYWKRSRELNLAGYNVYRSNISGSGYQRINYSLISRCSYTDKQKEKGKTYYYVVTAVNTSGGESGYSNEVEVTIVDKVDKKALKLRR